MHHSPISSRPPGRRRRAGRTGRAASHRPSRFCASRISAMNSCASSSVATGSMKFGHVGSFVVDQIAPSRRSAAISSRLRPSRSSSQRSVSAPSGRPLQRTAPGVRDSLRKHVLHLDRADIGAGRVDDQARAPEDADRGTRRRWNRPARPRRPASDKTRTMSSASCLPIHSCIVASTSSICSSRASSVAKCGCVDQVLASHRLEDAVRDMGAARGRDRDIAAVLGAIDVARRR